jgi:predicted dehydrogenase
MKGPFTCSIVGLGRIASLLEDDPLREKPATHAGAIAANPDCELLSACDTDPDRRKRFSERWGCAHVFESIDELFAFGKPDVLHVATPPDSHGFYVEKAVREGVPLVICEKPLSERVREAGKLAAFAARSKTILMVNHERRYSRDYLEVKKIIDEGKYGRLLSIHAFLYMGYGRTCREMLFEDGTHMADIIRFLTDREIGSIRAFGNPDEAAGNLGVMAKAGPVRVTIEAACDRDHLVFELVLGFERGRVLVGNGEFETWESAASPFYSGFNSLLKRADTQYADTGYMRCMLEDAIGALGNRDSGRVPVSGGMDGYRAILAIHTILKRSRPM